MMSQAAQIKPQIQEENWRVGDKIRMIRRLLQEHSNFPWAYAFLSSTITARNHCHFSSCFRIDENRRISRRARTTSSASLQIFAKEETL